MTDRPPMPGPTAGVRLLWTSGWDSTFRLLDALQSTGLLDVLQGSPEVAALDTARGPSFGGAP